VPRVLELVHFDLNQISRSQAGFASGCQDPLHPFGRMFVELGYVAARPDERALTSDTSVPLRPGQYPNASGARCTTIAPKGWEVPVMVSPFLNLLMRPMVPMGNLRDSRSVNSNT